MGGMSLKVNSSNWPLLINEKPVYYILNDSLFDKLGFCSSSFFNYSQTGLEYHDLMASVDLMLTKPGYGTFVEAVAVGLPLIYISRDIWPDVSSLVHWLEENGSAIGITRTDFLKGMFANEMKDLLDKGHYVPTSPDGAIQSASYIVSLLSNQEKGGN